jgi:N-acetylneuraminic acid mutarotase
VQFSSAAYSVNENGGSATITVTLSAPSPFTATVNFATSNGTAIAGSDYTAVSGTLTFTPGVTNQTFNVPIIDDSLFEDSETFLVGLTGASNATIGSPGSAQVTIVDNDPPPPLVCGSGAPGPWVLRNFLPTPVYGASVANDGVYAYALGGFSFQTGSDVTQTVRYDPIANAWTPLAPVPAAVTMASAVYAPINNKLYVFGGELVGTSQIYSTTRIYDISGNSWSIGAPMPDIRAFMGSGYYNGKIYLVGGYSTGNVTPAYAQTWEYDVLANTWVTKTAMPQALGGPASAVVNGHLYIIGGRNGSSSAITQTYDYDIVGDTWFTRTAIPVGVNVPGTAVLGGKVWVIGGGTPFLTVDAPQLASINAPETFSTTQIYDPIGNSWSSGPNLNIQRSFLGATGFGNFAVAIGGYNGSSTTGATEVTQNCPGVQFSAPTYSVIENVGVATITTTLNSVSGVTATVNYATSDGTATAGSDYTPVSGTLTFAPGQTSRTFGVPIINDIFKEPNETVNLTLSNAISVVLGSPNPAALTIVDNDYALYLPIALKN